MCVTDSAHQELLGLLPSARAVQSSFLVCGLGKEEGVRFCVPKYINKQRLMRIQNTATNTSKNKMC